MSQYLFVSSWLWGYKPNHQTKTCEEISGNRLLSTLSMSGWGHKAQQPHSSHSPGSLLRTSAQLLAVTSTLCRHLCRAWARELESLTELAYKPWWKDLYLLCVHMLWHSNTPCHSQPSIPVPICKLTVQGVCYTPVFRQSLDHVHHTDFKRKMPDAVELALHTSQNTSLTNVLHITKVHKCHQRADIRDYFPSVGENV